jgi:hypothetical protein
LIFIVAPPSRSQDRQRFRDDAHGEHDEEWGNGDAERPLQHALRGTLGRAKKLEGDQETDNEQRSASAKGNAPC